MTASSRRPPSITATTAARASSRVVVCQASGAAAGARAAASHRAAALDARGDALAGDVDRNCDADDLARIDAVEVEMGRLVGDRVELDVLGEDELALAFVFQRHRVRDELAGLEGLDDGFLVDRDRDRGFLATVEDSRNPALTAGFTCVAAARAFTHVDIEDNFRFSHFALRFALTAAGSAGAP